MNTLKVYACWKSQQACILKVHKISDLGADVMKICQTVLWIVLETGDKDAIRTCTVYVDTAE